MSELLPCPFCGGTDLDWTAEAADAVTFYGQIECHTCEAIMHSEECWGSEEDAEIDVKDKWNRRAPVSAPDGLALVPIEPTEDMVINGFESWPDEYFSKPEDWLAFEAMSGCQQAAHKARLCWAAMLEAAPTESK